jgi:hypothetical protein
MTRTQKLNSEQLLEHTQKKHGGNKTNYRFQQLHKPTQRAKTNTKRYRANWQSNNHDETKEHQHETEISQIVRATISKTNKGNPNKPEISPTEGQAHGGW